MPVDVDVWVTYVFFELRACQPFDLNRDGRERFFLLIDPMLQYFSAML
jgi:hypothetical protein